MTQKISSYKVIFYDMEDNEIDIDEYYMSQAYTEIDQAIYEWEREDA
jgi:hypothetical protein